VRNRILRLKNDYPLLEGVLFVGNIKLPSFYAPRNDILQSRLISHKYEDLDIVLRKNNPAVRADYDYIAKGQNPLPELWTAYLPVGYAGGALKNKYSDFARQVCTFLDKGINQRRSKQQYSKFYMVSNGLFDLGGILAEYGLKGVDFYAVNDTGYPPYQYTYPTKDPRFFYKRALIENFGAVENFYRYYRRFPGMGEGWQKDYIYMEHMQNNHYTMVWTDVHSFERRALISTQQAKSLIDGGLIQFLGCSTGGFYQPGSHSYVDTIYAPDENISCGYIYGNSDFLAALGDPFSTTGRPEFNRLAAFMTQGDYLGLAHYFRRCYQYHESGTDPQELKSYQEILIGDPFLLIKSQSLTQPPDLVVTGLKFYNRSGQEVTNLTAGQQVICKVTFKNQGVTPTSAFNAKWYIDGTVVGYGSQPGVAAGQTIESILNWTPSVGTHTLRFDVDCDNHIRESNERNNSLRKTVKVITSSIIPSQPNAPSNLKADMRTHPRKWRF